MAQRGMGGLGEGIAHSDTVDGAYTDITGATKIKSPKTTANMIEVPAALDGQHKSKALGSDDTDQCTFSKPYAKASHAALLALRRVLKWWKITKPDGGLLKFQGYLTEVAEPDADADSLKTSDCTIVPVDAAAFTTP